ncbi:MAG: hypothetical protein IT210_10170 [Armatimonadetes bacterium]|nr:hypothetical protein [Armatimonadota bacterium]
MRRKATGSSAKRSRYASQTARTPAPHRRVLRLQPDNVKRRPGDAHAQTGPTVTAMQASGLK